MPEDISEPSACCCRLCSGQSPRSRASEEERQEPGLGGVWCVAVRVTLRCRFCVSSCRNILSSATRALGTSTSCGARQSPPPSPGRPTS
eukprot:scaffold2134_cov110-Isochrysis_galbana.AAC.4